MDGEACVVCLWSQWSGPNSWSMLQRLGSTYAIRLFQPLCRLARGLPMRNLNVVELVMVRHFVGLMKVCFWKGGKVCGLTYEGWRHAE